MKLSISYTNKYDETTELNKICKYDENDTEYDVVGTIFWLVEQFKYFLKACGYAEVTTDRIVYLGHREKVVDSNGNVVFSPDKTNK